MRHAPQDQAVRRRAQMTDAFAEQIVNRPEILSLPDRIARLDGRIELPAERTLHPEIVVAQDAGSFETRRVVDHAELLCDVENAIHMEGDGRCVMDAVRAGLRCEGD